MKAKQDGKFAETQKFSISRSCLFSSQLFCSSSGGKAISPSVKSVNFSLSKLNFISFIQICFCGRIAGLLKNSRLWTLLMVIPFEFLAPL